MLLDLLIILNVNKLPEFFFLQNKHKDIFLSFVVHGE